MAKPPPLWLCCGWFSPWCIADATLHFLRRHLGTDRCGWVCEKHDAHIMRGFDKAEIVEVTGRPTVRIGPNTTTASNSAFTWKFGTQSSGD